jgi:hypothetical protein
MLDDGTRRTPASSELIFELLKCDSDKLAPRAGACLLEQLL